MIGKLNMFRRLGFCLYSRWYSASSQFGLLWTVSIVVKCLGMLCIAFLFVVTTKMGINIPLAVSSVLNLSLLVVSVAFFLILWLFVVLG